ncbi:MAG: histidine phosphatase family protein [Candidatus Magasanikbacteria bacterium]|nr:histidine phosphatase family protein [Candidatus Magasanikbacteria bacterium]
MAETLESPNRFEAEPSPRRLELILLRHGQAESQEKDAALNETGQHQAARAAEEIIEHVLAGGGGVVKIVRSSVRRAQETGAIIEETIRRLIAERGLGDKIRLIESRAKTRAPLVAAGIMRQLQILNAERPVEHWIENPEILPDKKPSDVAKSLQEMTTKMQQIVNKLRPGETIYYIGVTHEIPQAAFLNTITHQTLAELGGPIKNGESFTITLSNKPNAAPVLSFRGQTREFTLARVD